MFVRAFWNGALLLLAYDVFRILRRVLRHGKVLTALEDFIYWLFCTFWLLGYFYRENNGILRGYLFAGVLLGALACRFSVSKIFVRCGTGILKACGKILAIPLKIIKKAIKRLKFRMFRFKIYWYNKLHVDRGPKSRPSHKKDIRHEKRKKQRHPKNSRGPAKQAHDSGDHDRRLRADGGASGAGTELEGKAGGQ